MAVDKAKEIQISYIKEVDLAFGCRKVRRQKLLEESSFPCSCSQCSLEMEEEEDLEDNESMRTEIAEVEAEIIQLTTPLESVTRRDGKKFMKLANWRMKLIQELNLRDWFVGVMIQFYQGSAWARGMDSPIPGNDPEVFKQEALRYARMCGDHPLHICNKSNTVYAYYWMWLI